MILNKVGMLTRGGILLYGGMDALSMSRNAILHAMNTLTRGRYIILQEVSRLIRSGILPYSRVDALSI